jgi:biopolymer transport protein ExbD
MSANFGSSNSQDVDINITPIIDCFTVLITFLLASASFLSIGFFEVSTPGNAVDAAQTEPDTELVVRVKGNQIAEFREKGKKNGTLRFDLSKPESVKTMEAELDALKSNDYKLTQILVSADDEVGFQSLSQVMGHLNRVNLPVIVGEF